MSDQTVANSNPNAKAHSEKRSGANVNQEPSAQNDDLEDIFGKAEDPMLADMQALAADLEESFFNTDVQKEARSAAVEEKATPVSEPVAKAKAVEEKAAVVAEPVVEVDPVEEKASRETEPVVEPEESIHGWEKIKEIAQQVTEQKQEVKESVRTLIGWFGAKRRGSYVVRCIQQELEKGRIKTEPDFADAYINTIVRFVPLRHSSADVVDTFHDPTFRISQLPSADMTVAAADPDSGVKEATALVSISPDASVKEATTLMMLHDFSQLPVMTSAREVKGVISWESIGKHVALSNICGKVKDCMVRTVPEVKSDSSMFSAIELIVRHGFVLVRQHNKVISGIVTTTDLSLQFRQLAEPFLLVGEIENYIRFLIEYKFSLAQLQSARDPRDKRPIKAVSDLSFGEYVRLLENPENWEILDIPIDRTIFGKRLNKIRELRNEIMHFDPDPFDATDLETLRLFANFIRTVYLNKKS